MENGNPQIDLLIVDDDDEFRASVARRFLRRGFAVQEAEDGETALDLAGRRQFDVAIVDMMMPGISGLELLRRFKAQHADCATIMLTGQATVESAVEAMKIGAFDYLRKPFALSELEVIIQKAFDHRRLEKENVQLKEVMHRTRGSHEIVGESSAMRDVFRLIDKAAPTDKALLIQGESGTGKELVARAIHRASTRSEKPLVIINCAALPETLLESELFGHEKGAFTGAVSAKPGLFELADRGTLLIDEIGEMPGSLQAKLLRVLEDGSMRRVGSLKERRVDVRLLAATNRNMETEVKSGNFREDLYYRINVMSLQIPPLRERPGDIRLLVEHFLGPQWQIEPEAMRAIEAYHWPGNVRQLQNALERAKILSDDNTIVKHDLPLDVTRGAAPDGEARPGSEAALATVERAHIVEVLRREKGNKARTARLLGVNRRSLYRLIEKFEITPAEINDGSA
ncbi:MAG: sigma-54-dependent Fis family transcriptional regulator [Planctomycetota bacterium]|nr:MAG: sigma-54-dependent Fis family transcriptional regulator [Planctomycetota bacterium]REJ96480.1 MAG: sigma-54-dependent Fis family transcriptional regulator [Planctomycetota bacterium]REK25124.1 MAG: sigma-54-dependent Fis family transcriptional regulator [Planctomycetota bacterium]REK40516.1 MAG: sigma-54-dependent Fis family transcriptional regulator [Planctomycetota bacterium]